MSNTRILEERTERPRVARTIHRFSVLIILAWLAITVVLSIAVPPLEQVEREHSVSLSAEDAPSFKAAQRMGEAFNESTSSAVAVIVLEGQQPLGDDAHRYYDDLIRQLRGDPTHVQHIQDFWGDPLTAGAAQSADGKAAYVQVTLVGQPGQAMGNESVKFVQDIVARTPAPPGIKAYVTGGAAIIADMGESGNRTVILITVVSLTVIFLMLLMTFRSITTTIAILVTVGLELQVARGIIAFLGLHGIVGLTTFVVNLLVSIGIAAGTDYGIFFFGRYKEARGAGEDRETAFYTTYRGVAKVVLASGVTIAGAIFCLSFYASALLPTLGRPRRDRDPGRGRSGPYARSRYCGCGQPFGLVRPQAADPYSSMATSRHGDRPVARAYSCRHGGTCADRIIDAAGIQTQLQRPEVSPSGYPRQYGLRGRIATFSRIANDGA